MQGYYDTIVETKKEYESVTAYSVPDNQEGASGGYYEQGIRIIWTTGEPGGITNSGWYTSGYQDSPFDGVSVEEILNHIDQFGNLNVYFERWGASNKNRDNFIKNEISDACWTTMWG